MSDIENEISNRGESSLYRKKWIVNYAVNGLSICKDLHCLCGDKKIQKGSLRIGRRYPSPFDPESIAINWFHAKCMFNQQGRSRVGTQIIGDLTDLDGVDDILLADQELIDELIQGNIELVADVPVPQSTKRPEKSQISVKAGVKKKSGSGKTPGSASSANGGRRVSINRRDAGRVLLL